MTRAVASRRVSPAKAKKQGEKIFVCSYANCKKSFTVLRNKNRHEKLHLGIKPFACTYPGCKSAFSRNSDLTVHFRSHTGEQPYECKRDGCSKRFSRVSDLRLHERKHDGVKPFSCDAPSCGKSFARPWELRVHQHKMHSTSLCPMKAVPRPVFKDEDGKSSPTEQAVPSISPDIKIEGVSSSPRDFGFEGSPSQSPVPVDMEDSLNDLEAFRKRTAEIMAMTRDRTLSFGKMFEQDSGSNGNFLRSAVEDALGAVKDLPLASPSSVVDPTAGLSDNHTHGIGCGHEMIRHGDHLDFIANGQLHHCNEATGHTETHSLEVREVDSNTPFCMDTSCTDNMLSDLPALFDTEISNAGNKPGASHPHEHHPVDASGNVHVHHLGCGHPPVAHGDHIDFLVDSVLHHHHANHCDIHGSVESISNDSPSDCLGDILQFLN